MSAQRAWGEGGQTKYFRVMGTLNTTAHENKRLICLTYRPPLSPRLHVLPLSLLPLFSFPLFPTPAFFPTPLPLFSPPPPPIISFLWQGCHSSCPIRKWSGKKYFKVVEKSGNFIWSQRKLTFSRKIREKWSNLHAWSIPLKAGGNTRGHSTIFFLNEEGKFCWKFISLKERVERTAVRWGQKPLVDLKFCIFFGRGNLISKKSGKFEKWCMWQPCLSLQQKALFFSLWFNKTMYLIPLLPPVLFLPSSPCPCSDHLRPLNVAVLMYM